MSRSVKPVNRVDKALRIARDALDVANECSLREQTHRFMIQTIIGVLRDANVISPDAVSTIFVGSAAIMDAIESEDDATARTLAASRSYLEELARNFGIEIPQKARRHCREGE
jgi:hypothetical protein